MIKKWYNLTMKEYEKICSKHRDFEKIDHANEHIHFICNSFDCPLRRICLKDATEENMKNIDLEVEVEVKKWVDLTIKEMSKICEDYHDACEEYYFSLPLQTKKTEYSNPCPLTECCANVKLCNNRNNIPPASWLSHNMFKEVDV